MAVVKSQRILWALSLLCLGLLPGCGNAIEPERVSPQARVELPKIQTDPGYVDFLVEPYQGTGATDSIYPVVHMRMPKAHYFEDNIASGPYRTYGEYIVMFYPNFSGLADPENAECLMIAGHCRREMTVKFGVGPKDHWDDLRQRNIMNDELKKGYIRPEKRVSSYPGLELIGARFNRPSDPPDKYQAVYLSRDAQGQPEYVIRCDERVPSPACETAFRASRSPYVYISVDFVLALMPQWESVIRDTRAKIDSLIVKTYELPIPKKPNDKE
jgi:hypothetical protein